ncbi:hypothetical protein SAY87_029616 [Trapa incisa]|uniref:LOB domain-containing protein n=1 Tax=Trapa incisa TaxID=236973 RepID=A0AAN7Q963_9MYRT|nr:hypothetical protein SAY87_029616 [Trapa incisa]
MEIPNAAMSPTVFHAPPVFTISAPPISSSSSYTSSSSPPHLSTPTGTTTAAQPPQIGAVASPCAACKILRRRCAMGCVLAPYFPPTEPQKFTIAHRVFGASNITKFLLELPESHREDAVSSMVYEANVRLRNPVYGCAGAIFHLQNEVSDLQAQLAKSQAELFSLQAQHASLKDALICKEMSSKDYHLQQHHPNFCRLEPTSISLQQFNDTSCFFEDDDSTFIYEGLWC